MADQDFPCGCFNPVSRRRFLSELSLGMGSAALASLLGPARMFGAGGAPEALPLGVPHFAPKAKRVIYLFQSGGPSHRELFDYKPMLEKLHGKQIPESVRGM